MCKSSTVTGSFDGVIQCLHNYSVCNHCVNLSHRQMWILQNNTFIVIVKAVQGNRVNADAKKLHWKRTENISYNVIPLKTHKTSFPHHIASKGQLFLEIKQIFVLDRNGWVKHSGYLTSTYILLNPYNTFLNVHTIYCIWLGIPSNLCTPPWCHLNKWCWGRSRHFVFCIHCQQSHLHFHYLLGHSQLSRI